MPSFRLLRQHVRRNLRLLLAVKRRYPAITDIAGHGTEHIENPGELGVSVRGCGIISPSPVCDPASFNAT